MRDAINAPSETLPKHIGEASLLKPALAPIVHLFVTNVLPQRTLQQDPHLHHRHLSHQINCHFLPLFRQALPFGQRLAHTDLGQIDQLHQLAFVKGG